MSDPQYFLFTTYRNFGVSEVFFDWRGRFDYVARRAASDALYEFAEAAQLIVQDCAARLDNLAINTATNIKCAGIFTPTTFSALYSNATIRQYVDFYTINKSRNELLAALMREGAL